MSPSLGWAFASRLPNFIPVFEAELLAVTLTLRKLTLFAFAAVIITNSFSVCSSLAASSNSPVLKVFLSLSPLHLSLLRLLYVPRHSRLYLNDMTDS